MSGSLFLQKKKKADLQVMAKELGLDYNNKLKNELEQELTQHLTDNEAQLQSHPTFAPYYETLSESPVKSNAAANTVARRRSRHFSKSTATDEESPEPAALQSPTTTRKRASARTPRASALRAASNIPLPMSPGDLADAMNTRTIQRFTDAVTDTGKSIVEKTGAVEKIAYTKETLSNVDTLTAITLIYEFSLLMRDLIPIDYYQLDVPVPAYGDTSVILNIPNLFVILSYSIFWRPLLFWAVNSLLLPLTAAYFVNLRQTSRYDPLSFSVARGLSTYFVYQKQLLNYSKIGLFSEDTGPLVTSIIGTEVPFISSAVTGLAAIWEAIVNRA